MSTPIQCPNCAKLFEPLLTSVDVQCFACGYTFHPSSRHHTGAADNSVGAKREPARMTRGAADGTASECVAQDAVEIFGDARDRLLAKILPGHMPDAGNLETKTPATQPHTNVAARQEFHCETCKTPMPPPLMRIGIVRQWCANCIRDGLAQLDRGY